jgi:beta-N-acetylhexosaminidase
MVEQAREHLKGVPEQALLDSLRRVERVKRRVKAPKPWSRDEFDQVNREIWDLRVATLGEERAAALSVEDGKRSAVELY